MTLKDKITRTPEGLRAWHQERTIFETTNMICRIMAENGVSRSELANKLDRSKGYITQLLDGTTNMTLRTVSDVFLALGREFHPAQSPLEQSQSYVAEFAPIPSESFAGKNTSADLTFSTQFSVCQ